MPPREPKCKDGDRKHRFERNIPTSDDGRGRQCSFPERPRHVLPHNEKIPFVSLRRPVCECRGAVWGFARPGQDFSMSFAAWLTVNTWLTFPEAPALHVLWHDGKGKERQSWRARSALVGAAETFSAEPWRNERWRTAAPVTEALAPLT